MSDAVHVTIDDLLFVIGPNTSHISSLDVSLISILCLIKNFCLPIWFRIIHKTPTTTMKERIHSGTSYGAHNDTSGYAMLKEKKRGKQIGSRKRSRPKNLRNRSKNLKPTQSRRKRKKRRLRRTESQLRSRHSWIS